jgi:signal transduction histidine kinase
MKVLWPRSLFGRLTLILLAGTIASQFVGGLLVFGEVRRAGFLIHNDRVADRIGDVVRLLDQATPAERSHIIRILSNPRFRINVGEPDLHSRPDTSPEMATQLQRSFANSLEGPRDIQVTVTPGPRPARVPSIFFGPPQSLGLPDPQRQPGPNTALPLPLPPGGVAFFHELAVPPEAPGSAAATPPHLPLRLPLPPPPEIWNVVDARFTLTDGAKLGVHYLFNADSFGPPAWRLVSDVLLRVAVIMIAVLIAVRLATRPLETLAVAAQDLGEKLDRPPLPETGAEEISQAARAFNTMQERIRRYVGDRTRMLAAVSHDLKTPLTRMRLNAERLTDPALKAKFERDLGEMEDMVTGTLDFMHGLAATESEKQQVDVDALLESLVEDIRASGREISLRGQVGRNIAAYPKVLRRCLQNLIDNAIQYGHRADIEVSTAAGTLSIAIRDSGPGIPAERAESVFQPFYRLEESRNRNSGGVGLGLSIAREIARGHGGDIALKNLAPIGLEVLLTLPM